MEDKQEHKLSFGDALEEALKVRKQLLKDHPDLQPLQDEIDRIFDKTPGFENRMSILAFMIEAKLYELRDSIAQIASVDFKQEPVDNSANPGRYLH
jgi:hypothetical protein